MSDDNTNQMINPADPRLVTTDQQSVAAPAVVQLTAEDIAADQAAALQNDVADSGMGGFSLAASDPIQPIMPPASTAPEPNAVNDNTDDTNVDQNLLSLKQQALKQLTPLVDKLDQEPLEKFRTTMMMIQANDDKDLIQTAFSAAQSIESDNERAQALLDIINEINYFTQK